MILSLNAANVIACIIGTVASETATAGAGTVISGALSLAEVLRRLRGKTLGINAKIAADLQVELGNHHLSDAQKTLIPQMIENSPLLPAEVMASARNPARICAAMLAKLTDPAHQTPVAVDAFRRVVVPVLTRLLADTVINDTLRPAFEDAVADSLRFIGEQVEVLTTQMHTTAYRLGVQDTLVKELARRYAPGSEGDFNAACLGLENALQTAAAMQAAAHLPHKTTDQVDAVLARVNALNSDGHLDTAAEALIAARKAARDRIFEHTSELMRLLDSTVTQARLRNLPKDAADALVERLSLAPSANPFATLRALQDEWFENGRDKGLTFDATVAIHLAEHSVTRAQTTDQRGMALNDLATALETLGEREPGTTRLEMAATAYTEALRERTRDRVPREWALVQMNLGNTLRSLGERELGTLLLEQAVFAFTEALKEITQDRMPLDWATIQMNLGNALQTLGEREQSTERLEQAVVAYSQALKERERGKVPLQWATTHINLGNALAAIGERGSDKLRLEQAVAAYREALKEVTRSHLPMLWGTTQLNFGTSLASLGVLELGTARLEQANAAYAAALLEYSYDRVPLQWAILQGNLANLDLMFFDKTADPARLVSARDFATAARDVFVAADSGHYVAVADRILADIDKRLN